MNLPIIVAPQAEAQIQTIDEWWRAIPAANTHLPTTMVAERIADWLAQA